VGHQPLEDGEKSGRAEQWIGPDTCFSRWQHWRIPIDSVVAASAADPATATDRSALDDINDGEGRHRAASRDA
jgi:hypothetical protein